MSGGHDQDPKIGKRIRGFGYESCAESSFLFSCVLSVNQFVWRWQRLNAGVVWACNYRDSVEGPALWYSRSARGSTKHPFVRLVAGNSDYLPPATRMYLNYH